MAPSPQEAHVSQEEAAPQADESAVPRARSISLLSHTLAAMVGGLSSVCIKQLLLPLQVSALAPTDTNTAFTIVASLGALAGLIASPLAGALSDRTTLRWGRRRPWIVGGLITAVGGMLLMAGATTIPALLLGEIGAQIGVDTILSMVTAMLPDRVPGTRRSLLSACIGVAPNVGGVAGLLLVTRLTNPQVVAQGYELLAAVSALCILFFLFVARERPITRDDIPPFHLRHFVADFVRPLARPDFTYTLTSRCCVYLAFTIVSSYLLFYVRDGLHTAPSHAAQDVTFFQVCSTGVLLLVAIGAGSGASRWQRLKPFLMGGAVLMALGLSIIALVPLWSALIGAAVIFGAGCGLYLGVDLNLAVRVLSSERAGGKDLGIMYTAIYFPLILSTLVGGPLLNLSHNNFALLFALAAVSCLLAAGLLLPLKAVR
ncbi:MAG TPA: MFS transporter [Ktedonobacteraceae bacterium]|nr:MFS transporter [Ktedonobacteraceae bacterium]